MSSVRPVDYAETDDHYAYHVAYISTDVANIAEPASKQPPLSALILVVGYHEMLIFLLPALSPDLRTFVSKLLTDANLWRDVFSATDEHLLVYC